MAQKIVGHTHILNFFDRLMTAGSVGHAYIFVGPAHVGKRTVALSLAGRLAGTAGALGMNTDIRIVERQYDEKNERWKRDISVDQIRESRLFLSTSSFGTGYRVVIVDGAERMTEEAHNALLKTLEEPAGKACLYLLCEDETALPETIRSRCQLFHFLPVARSEIESFLMAEGVAETRARELAGVSLGLPGRALVFARDPERYATYSELISDLSLLPSRPLYAILDWIEHKTKKSESEDEDQREALHEMLCVWRLVIRDWMFASAGIAEDSLLLSGGRTAPKKYARSALLEIDRRIGEALVGIGHNISPRMLCEHIAFAL